MCFLPSIVLHFFILLNILFLIMNYLIILIIFSTLSPSNWPQLVHSFSPSFLDFQWKRPRSFPYRQHRGTILGRRVPRWIVDAGRSRKTQKEWSKNVIHWIWNKRDAVSQGKSVENGDERKRHVQYQLQRQWPQVGGTNWCDCQTIVAGGLP